jgi:hypothetical protein
MFSIFLFAKYETHFPTDSFRSKKAPQILTVNYLIVRQSVKMNNMFKSLFNLIKVKIVNIVRKRC